MRKFSKTPAKLDADGLWAYALRVLARRPHSLGELRQKLRRRATQLSEVTATLDKLREYGLADDEKFSEAFASARLQNQGFGKQRVLRDLSSKQVASTTADEAVAKIFGDTNENDLIRQFLERKYRGKNLALFLQEEKNLLSVYRRLRVAGFASTPCLAILRQYKSDLPDVDEAEEAED